MLDACVILYVSLLLLQNLITSNKLGQKAEIVMGAACLVVVEVDLSGLTVVLLSRSNKFQVLDIVFPWTPAHGHTRVGRPTETFIHQLCADTEHSLKNLPRAMDDKNGETEGRRERDRERKRRLNDDKDYRL